ncbi:glycosyltransferase family 2 protein [Niallia sp. FSL W8-0951]|uniref:glycosyltransferase family 2 protein n=1 Tax=Niallia sp. FSL W8-0951 TaxID=2954639 RepID=UPI0030FB6F76
MVAVSVVIPLYNKEQYIERTIMSILSQTFQDFEIIIVDDGSTDGSVERAETWADDRIKVLKMEHKGASAARNKGILAATAELITFIDADDEWKPGFLEKIIYLKDKYPECGAYATSYEIVLPTKKKIIPSIYQTPEKWEGIFTNYVEKTLKDLPIISSAIAVRKQVFDKIGLFKEGEPLGEDQDMWLRIGMNYSIAYINESYAIYYRGLENSVCMDLTILNRYPIIYSLENLLHKEEFPYIDLYLSKLKLDYSKRLLEANKLDSAWQELQYTKANIYKWQKIKLWLFYYWKKISNKYSFTQKSIIKNARKL